MRSFGLWLVLVGCTAAAACASARAKDTARRTDAPTAVIATQKAGLPSHLDEADPDAVERRFGHGAERARREQRAQKTSDRQGRVEVDPPASSSTLPLGR